MKFLRTDLAGVIVIEPSVHRDPRGFFLETYHAPRFRENGIDATFVQDNHSGSVRGALRGLHVQVAPRAQAKLVRAVEGEVLDVAADVRVGSPAFGRSIAVLLSSENHRQLYIPPGFAHGFCVLSERAQVEYKCSEVYDPSCELAIAWNDPELAIRWPVEEPILSGKDRAAPRLAEVRDRLPRYRPAQGGA